MRFYKFAYCIMFVIVRLMYRFRYRGRELVPEGPAIICAPHSSLIDPVLVYLAAGNKKQIHFMAKKELTKNKLVGTVLHKCGAYFVDRGAADVTAVKTTIKHLKEGDKVMIFPEGTRKEETDYSAAKKGAVRIAARTGVPIVPVYIPRNKKYFHKVEVIIGEAYSVLKPGADDGPDYYDLRAQELMRRLEELGG